MCNCLKIFLEIARSTGSQGLGHTHVHTYTINMCEMELEIKTLVESEDKVDFQSSASLVSMMLKTENGHCG